MHAQPPRTLKRILKQYGQELIDDPRRTEALLRDLCGQHTREIFVLVNAQKQRVPSELIGAPAWMPRQATYSRLSKQLQTKLALTEDAADWAVASWAAALELEALPKGEAWSWLPGQTRTPAPTNSRKGRNKKRQNPVSSVQSTKSNTRSTRQAKERSARAEMNWGFPFFNFAHLWQQIKTPAMWANLLPWIALFAATVFLVAVIYWTSSTRNDTALGPESAAASETAAANENGAGATPNAPNANNTAAIVNSNVTPLPELPAPARDYVEAIIALPTWANVNVAEDQPLLVREGPSTTYGFITTLQDSTPVSVVAFSEDGRWSQIRSPYEGWVNNDYLLFISDAATQPRITINVQPRHAPNQAVNVYAAPLADAAVSGTLTPGEFVVVAAATGDPVSWYQIAAPTVGWVAVQDLMPTAP